MSSHLANLVERSPALAERQPDIQPALGVKDQPWIFSKNVPIRN